MAKSTKLHPHEKLQQLRQQLNAANLERENIIDGLLATLIASGNAVLYGPPGTAKSDLLRSLCHAIDGATYFQRLLQRAMPPEEVLGQISLKALEDDVLRRNTKQRLPEAHIAFLDEIFKCSPTVLNALLGLLNERIFENPTPEEVPLEFVCGAANRVPQEEELAPFVDRFIYRPLVPYIKRESNIKKLLDWACDRSRPTVETGILTLEDLQTFKHEASQIPVSPAMREEYLKALAALADKGFEVSNRRMVQLIRLLRCYAYVQGDEQVLVDHLQELLPQCLWRQDETEIREITNILKDICPSAIMRLREIRKVLLAMSGDIEKLSSSFDPEESKQHKKRCQQQSLSLTQLEERLQTIDDLPSRQDTKQITQLQQQIEDFKSQVSQAKELAYA